MTSGAAPGISWNSALSCVGHRRPSRSGRRARLDLVRLIGILFRASALVGPAQQRRKGTRIRRDRSLDHRRLPHPAGDRQGRQGRSGRPPSPAARRRRCSEPWPSATGSTPPTWTTSSGARPCRSGRQGGDLGRMAALDAGYATTASGVTLDRFCGSGITTVNFAAASVMSGMEDVVIAGGTEMMSSYAANVVARRARPSSTGQRCTCAPSIPRRTRASPPTPSPRWRGSTVRPSTNWR